MKINEVVDELGITKKAIYYYEEIGLINISRTDNGYRTFDERDVKCLKFIQTLRNMNISIDDIKRVLNGKISLIDCIERKKEEIMKQIEVLEDMQKDIEDLLTRKKVFCIYKEAKKKEMRMNIFFYNQIDIDYEKEDYLLFNNDSIIYHHSNQETEIIDYNSIKKITLFMCSRMQNTAKTFTRFGQPMFTAGNRAGPYVYYNIDFDIELKDGFFKFESRGLDDIKEILNLLKEKTVLKDQLGLVNIFNSETDKVKLYNYINVHFREWAKEYGLDNPRKQDDYLLGGYLKSIKKKIAD